MAHSHMAVLTMVFSAFFPTLSALYNRVPLQLRSDDAEIARSIWRMEETLLITNVSDSSPRLPALWAKWSALAVLYRRNPGAANLVSILHTEI